MYEDIIDFICPSSIFAWMHIHATSISTEKRAVRKMFLDVIVSHKEFPAGFVLSKAAVTHTQSSSGAAKPPIGAWWCAKVNFNNTWHHFLLCYLYITIQKSLLQSGESPSDWSYTSSTVWKMYLVESIRFSGISRRPLAVMHWEKSPLIALRGDAALTCLYCVVL